MSQAFDQLTEIMRRLRDPERGCPWDVQQNFTSIAPYTLEEAYEVVDAIERGDMTALRAELGDLLLQVMFHAQMAAEAGHFTVEDVVNGIAEKMLTRHPHVFGEAEIADANAQTQAWEALKAQERQTAGQSSSMDDVPLALPTLVRAHKLQKRAAHVGFDWPEIQQVADKVEEEWQEVSEAMQANDKDAVEEEIGDLLFVLVNLARHAGTTADVALRRANAKFEQRFRAMEQLAQDEGNMFASLSLQAQEALWQRVKLL
jgi:nucleoside triphosphate diphosphatase